MDANDTGQKDSGAFHNMPLDASPRFNEAMFRLEQVAAWLRNMAGFSLANFLEMAGMAYGVANNVRVDVVIGVREPEPEGESDDKPEAQGTTEHEQH